MSKNCNWYFPIIQNGHKQGQNDGMTDLFSGPTFHALVREALQNSLDARQDDNDDPVRVEFKLRRISEANNSGILSIREHVVASMKACDESMETEGGKFSSMVKYIDAVKGGELLVLDISDYNTKGMDYHYDEEQNEESGTFDSFVRCSGKPNANDGSGGSHGYGKTTYFNASRVRCLLVSSMTSKDNKCFFEGVSWLCSHKIDRDYYDEWGFFDSNDGRPIQADIDTYKELIPEDFWRKEPGTTVSIIGADIEPGSITWVYQQILQAIFRNFFAAINKNRLIVEVNFGDDMHCLIDDEAMHKMLPVVFTDEFDYAKQRPIDRCNPRPYLKVYENAVLIADKDTPIEEAIENRKNKSFIKIQDHLDIIGDVSFYGYIHPGATDTILYMRTPLMVVHATRDKSTKGFYGLFVCDDKNGNDYLKQMENADHKRWEKEKFARTKDQSKYERAEKIQVEMNAFIEKCVQIMFPQSESQEEDLSFEEFTIPTLSEPNAYDSLIGQLISEKPQEDGAPGAPVDVELSDAKPSTPPSGGSKGFAYPVKDVNTRREERGDYTGGRKGKKKNKKREQKGTPPFGGGGFEDDNGGTPSKVKESIPVTFRFIPDDGDEMGKFTLKITSPCAAENVTVEIGVVGETTDSQDGGNLRIDSVSTGAAKGNMITGIVLSEGDGNMIDLSLSNYNGGSFSLKAIGEITQ